MESATVFANAKINLTLEVLGRRADGYHALRSVMVPIALADELRIASASRFSFACEPPALAADNLVVRALARLGLAEAPVDVALRKRVPVGAGLGGGSSDAAAVLRAAMDGRLGEAPRVAGHDWIAEARGLGSDVPFFLVDGPALVEGTGERVTALGSAPPWWLVLAVPPVHVDTGDAYRRLAAARAACPPPPRPRNASVSLACAQALQRHDYDGVVTALSNDFDDVVRGAHAEVDAVLRALSAAGAPGRAMLSGSGGACYALHENEHEARAFAERLDAPSGTRVEVVPFARSAAWR